MTTRPPAPPRVLVVAAALVDDLVTPTTLLSARRSAPAELAGRWEFPGGKVDPGERPEQALHRELREELGIEVLLGSEVVGAEADGWVLSEKYVMRLWLARLTAGTPEPLADHDALRWLPRGAWLSVPWLDADLPLVDYLVRHL